MDSTRKVRIVARIRGLRDHELIGGSNSVISVRKSEDGGLSQRCTLSFGDQTLSRKDSYEVDYCYEQNEENATIFSREVKPHIPRVFDGDKATFIAFGARGSGKTYTIRGSEEQLGIAMLAMDEILKVAEGRNTVAVSFYEVFQDHVYDLLDSKHPEVQVLEDQGKIMLKGLSQVPVKLISEFQKLYCNDSSSSKQTQKTVLEVPRRSHKGMMIHILACDENSDSMLVGKMNFVDLAGYENVRRNSVDGTNLIESTRINKSLNTLLNVIHAINANESRVPYRESKLTRVLQDSFGGTNHVLMLTCLNPLFCPDSIHAISLSSRSCLVTKTLTTPLVKKVKPVSVCSTTKKQTSSRLPLSAKKANSLIKGRKLFGESNQLISSNQAKNPSDTVAVKSEFREDASVVVTSSQEEISMSGADQQMKSSVMEKKDASQKRENKANENSCSLINEDRSPPLSVKLKEISNNLKSLCTATPLPISFQNQVGFVDNVEPKTPADNRDVSNFRSPLETFSKRSSGMKQSLVEDYLQFLNTASKEDLKESWGIGEKRATYILKLREKSPQPFRNLDDLEDIGLSAKQVKNMMKKVAGKLFN